MKKRVILAVSALAISASLGACRAPVDPSYVPQHFTPERLARMEIIVTELTGTVRTSEGVPVGGVRVSVESPRYTEDARTSNDGYFDVTAKYAEGDSLEFRFRGAGLEWTETVTALPRGIARINLRFEVTPVGKIQLAAIEY